MRGSHLLSGSAAPVELVVFESSRGSFLDNGVANALISHLESQCGPDHISLIKLSNTLSDFQDMSGASVISADDVSLLMKHISAVISEARTQLIVLDSLAAIIMHESISGLVRLMHVAREAARACSARVTFAAVLHCEDFNESQVHSIRGLATTVVEVSQRATRNVVVGDIDEDFEVWDEVVMRIGRRKPSGRVNVDVVAGKFDAEECRLANILVLTEQAVSQGGDAKDDYVKKLNLPFKVALSDRERRSRAAVTLPYVHRDVAVANSALELHPGMLQITERTKTDDTSFQASSASDEEAFCDEDGEDLFSEDV